MTRSVRRSVDSTNYYLLLYDGLDHREYIKKQKKVTIQVALVRMVHISNNSWPGKD